MGRAASIVAREATAAQLLGACDVLRARGDARGLPRRGAAVIGALFTEGAHTVTTPSALDRRRAQPAPARRGGRPAGVLARGRRRGPARRRRPSPTCGRAVDAAPPLPDPADGVLVVLEARPRARRRCSPRPSLGDGLVRPGASPPRARRAAGARRPRGPRVPPQLLVGAGRLPRRRPVLRAVGLPHHVAPARGARGHAARSASRAFWGRRARRLLPGAVRDGHRRHGVRGPGGPLRATPTFIASFDLADAALRGVRDAAVRRELVADRRAPQLLRAVLLAEPAPAHLEPRDRGAVLPPVAVRDARAARQGARDAPPARPVGVGRHRRRVDGAHGAALRPGRPVARLLRHRHEDRGPRRRRGARLAHRAASRDADGGRAVAPRDRARRPGRSSSCSWSPRGPRGGIPDDFMFRGRVPPRVGPLRDRDRRRATRGVACSPSGSRCVPSSRSGS